MSNYDVFYKKYPKILKVESESMKSFPMFGFECDDGWFNILDTLMSNIQHYIDWKNEYGEVVAQVTLDQVKEKYGTLRFYYSGGDDYVSGLVNMAESISTVTCETCGNLAKLRGKGWFYTACDAHTKPEHLESDNDLL